MTDHVSSGRAACRRRRCAALIAAGVLLPVPVLAGCSEKDTTASVAESRDIAPAPRGTLKDGGTVRWAVDAVPGTFNAFQSDADATTARITGAVLPSLFTVDANGRPQRNADYLDAADVTAREPRQVVTYRLNPKARWSDGRPIEAADFIAQWNALRGRDNAYWTARNAGYDRIAKVEAGAGPHQVKVTFARPYADWQSLFTPLYPKSVMGSPHAFNDKSRSQLAIGAGPFSVQKRDADRRTVTLVRNPKWWGDPARLDRLVLAALPRDKRVAALSAGTVDVAALDPAGARRVTAAGGSGDAQAADAKAAAPENSAGLRGFTVRKALEPAYTQLALNGGAGPLSDDRVRRAVARAIDRQALADTVLKPLDLPSRPLGSHLLMAGQQGYEDHSDALGDPDPAAARKLLADAGWKPAGGSAPQEPGEKAGAGRAVPPDVAEDAGDAGYRKESGVDRPGDGTSADQSGDARSDGRNPAQAGRARHHGADAAHGDQEEGTRPAPADAPLSFAGAVGSEVQQAALLRQSATFYKAGAAEEKAAAAGDTGSAAYAKYRRYKKRAAQALGAAELIETGQAPNLPGSAGHLAARQMRAERSPEAAAAGRPGRAPVLRKDGKPLALRFVLPDGAGSEQLRTVGRRIAGMLDKIGVRTSIQRVPDVGYFQDHIASGDYDLALYSWPGTAFPATDARPIFAKPQPAPDGSLTVEQNYTRVGTDHIDQLFDQAASELDADAARTLVQQADARIWAAAGSIPLYQRPELVATRKSLANIGAFGFAAPRFQDIGYRK
ncbi:ABC transporter family substrate-binding protein [Streptomyces sp. CT34]|uniref:ABC transporter family substrate-binding protein n=1 Tax=Streptomyces sp. CT34 TaxID=1553907 RepID=UPI0005B8D376|nr:ABC transporter family substrate-binding protein [Streptomyces sp. CT34]